MWLEAWSIKTSCTQTTGVSPTRTLVGRLWCRLLLFQSTGRNTSPQFSCVCQRACALHTLVVVLCHRVAATNYKLQSLKFSMISNGRRWLSYLMELMGRWRCQRVKELRREQQDVVRQWNLESKHNFHVLRVEICSICWNFLSTQCFLQEIKQTIVTTVLFFF